MRVVVYGPLRSATGEKTIDLTVGGGTVRDVLETFVEEYPRARGQLFDADDSLRASVRVTQDGERVDLDVECADEEELSIFPAVQGG